jgi:ABC-2 type transport system permease protein
MTDTIPSPRAATRPFYWTIRRELWENRSIYIAPAVVGLLELLALLMHGLRHPQEIQAAADVDGVDLQVIMGAGYGGLALPILATALIVSVF